MTKFTAIRIFLCFLLLQFYWSNANADKSVKFEIHFGIGGDRKVTLSEEETQKFIGEMKKIIEIMLKEIGKKDCQELKEEDMKLLKMDALKEIDRTLNGAKFEAKSGENCFHEFVTFHHMAKIASAIVHELDTIKEEDIEHRILCQSEHGKHCDDGKFKKNLDLLLNTIETKLKTPQPSWTTSQLTGLKDRALALYWGKQEKQASTKEQIFEYVMALEKGLTVKMHRIGTDWGNRAKIEARKIGSGENKPEVSLFQKFNYANGSTKDKFFALSGGISQQMLQKLNAIDYRNVHKKIYENVSTANLAETSRRMLGIVPGINYLGYGKAAPALPTPSNDTAKIMESGINEDEVDLHSPEGNSPKKHHLKGQRVEEPDQTITNRMSTGGSNRSSKTVIDKIHDETNLSQIVESKDGPSKKKLKSKIVNEEVNQMATNRANRMDSEGSKSSKYLIDNIHERSLDHFKAGTALNGERNVKDSEEILEAKRLKSKQFEEKFGNDMHKANRKVMREAGVILDADERANVSTSNGEEMRRESSSNGEEMKKGSIKIEENKAKGLAIGGKEIGMEEFNKGMDKGLKTYDEGDARISASNDVKIRRESSSSGERTIKKKDLSSSGEEKTKTFASISDVKTLDLASSSGVKNNERDSASFEEGKRHADAETIEKGSESDSESKKEKSAKNMEFFSPYSLAAGQVKREKIGNNDGLSLIERLLQKNKQKKLVDEWKKSGGEPMQELKEEIEAARARKKAEERKKDEDEVEMARKKGKHFVKRIAWRPAQRQKNVDVGEKAGNSDPISPRGSGTRNFEQDEHSGSAKNMSEAADKRMKEIEEKEKRKAQKASENEANAHRHQQNEQQEYSGQRNGPVPNEWRQNANANSAAAGSRGDRRHHQHNEPPPGYPPRHQQGGYDPFAYKEETHIKKIQNSKGAVICTVTKQYFGAYAQEGCPPGSVPQDFSDDDK